MQIANTVISEHQTKTIVTTTSFGLTNGVLLRLLTLHPELLQEVKQEAALQE